jgi:hypothetical protein
MTETRATYTVQPTCDVAEAAGHPVDCEHCPGCGVVHQQPLMLPYGDSFVCARLVPEAHDAAHDLIWQALELD